MRNEKVMIDGQGEAAPKPEGRARVLYYLIGIAPPAKCSEWVRRDVQTGGWLWRRVGQSTLSVALGFVVSTILLDASPWMLVGMALGLGIAGLLELTVWASWIRERSMRYYEKRWNRTQAGSHPVR